MLSSVPASVGRHLPSQLVSPLPPPGTVPLAIAASVAIALAVGGLVRWRGRRAFDGPETDAETAAHLGRLRRRGLAIGWLLTALVTLRLDTQAVAYFTLHELVPQAVALAVAPLLAYLLPLLPVAVAVRLATVPYRRATRDLRVRYRDAAAWELERDGVGLVGVLAATVLLALVPAGWPRALAAVGLGLVATAVTPFALVVALRTRWPTDDELAVFDGVLAGARLRVVDDRTRVGSAFAAGIVPGARYVFLTESLFAVLDDDQLRAVAAHEVGHHECDHVLLRYSLVALAAAGALGLVELFSAQTALTAIALGAVPFALAMAWVVRATERGADAYAAEVVGGPALASALERLAERRYIVESGGSFQALSHHPPLAERVASLRGDSPTAATG